MTSKGQSRYTEKKESTFKTRQKMYHRSFGTVLCIVPHKLSSHLPVFPRYIFLYIILSKNEMLDFYRFCLQTLGIISLWNGQFYGIHGFCTRLERMYKTDQKNASFQKKKILPVSRIYIHRRKVSCCVFFFSFP